MRLSARLVLTICVILAGSPPARGQSQGPPVAGEEPAAIQIAAPAPAPAAGKRAVALWREQAPSLDGNVLDDPAWAAVQPVSGFRQSAPDEGQPATQRTEVRVLFTDDTLYFGVVCYDKDPSAIIMSDSRRDSSMNDADSFQMVLDTFQDRQNGFVFGTTPAGQEYDGQVTDEGGGRGSFRRGGGGGGFSRGSGNGFNLNWDGAWQVQTEISDIGWSAEFAIPFRTIRYPDRDDQVWGMNFQRNIRRRNETAYWAPLPRQYNLYRVSLAGQLTGVRAPIGFTGNLQITPYVIGEMVSRDIQPGRPETLGDFGADLKYSVTSGLTLDATLRTDFAQVEVDDQQINLDRFSLFFPEKRPFFLENAGAFAVSNQTGGRNLGQTELFFSRRIGIDTDTGAPIPILGGARLSGKVNDSTTVGFLNMQTEQVGTARNTANNFSVARLRRDLPNRSSIGGLFVNRQGTSLHAPTDDYNRTYAFDGRWGIGQNGMVQGFVGRTETPGLEGRDHALSVSSQYSSEAWRLVAGYQENGDHFNPEVGYEQRRDRGFRNVNFSINNTTRPDGFLKYQELSPHMSFSRFWNFDGIMETTFAHFHYTGEFEDSSSAGVNYDMRQEYVFQDFTVSGLTVPAGRWDFNEVSYSYNSDRSAPFSAGIRATQAGFFNGNIVTLRPSINARYGETFNLSLSYSRNNIDLPSGSTVTNLSSVDIGYNFSPRLYAQTLLQHNDSADLWSVNFRLGWLQDANTGLFFVYNETDGLGDFIPSYAGRSVILKYSYLFDVLD